jgi:hypothetical protein
MGITKDVFDILAQNQKVRDAFNKGVDVLMDAVTGQAPSIADRRPHYSPSSAHSIQSLRRYRITTRTTAP